jgi:prepilin-type N-terminal cleavage/methylation domain-containing protein
MRRQSVQSGMTLIEILVVLATVVILAGTLVGLGKHIVTRGKVDLTESAIEVIVTALEQYYTDHEAFPFVTDADGFVEIYTVDDLIGILAADNEIAIIDVTVTGSPSGDDPSSVGLFYFLNKSPNSRKIIDALTTSLIANGYGSTPVTATLTLPTGGKTIDLPRFVDVWENTIRYEYADGAAFPVLTSAGPDGDFTTIEDNITSK